MPPRKTSRLERLRDKHGLDGRDSRPARGVPEAASESTMVPREQRRAAELRSIARTARLRVKMLRNDPRATSTELES
jgi:hypothetical protein